jgi:hypothetical protein
MRTGGGNAEEFGTSMVLMTGKRIDGLENMDMDCIPTAFWHSSLANMRSFLGCAARRVFGTLAARRLLYLR